MRLPQPYWRWWRLDAVGAALCVVLTLAAYLGGLSPLLNRREHLAAQQKDLAARQAQAATLETKLVALRAQLEATRRALAGNTLRLKPVSNINLQVAEISALAAASGLAVDDIKTGSPVSGACYEAVPIRLAGSGTYRECTAFLRRLREVLPDTGALALALDAHKSDPTQPGTFRIDLHWHATSGPGPGSAAPVP